MYIYIMDNVAHNYSVAELKYNSKKYIYIYTRFELYILNNITHNYSVAEL
jgi:hypothetical protein